MTEADKSALVRLKTIGLSRVGGRKPCTLLQAARHNLREDQKERGGRAHIDAAHTHLNVVLAGPIDAKGVVGLARERMEQAGVNVAKLRRDYVQAVELMFSLPVNSGLDDVAYFNACLDWSARRFGGDMILSAVIHRDESAPHCHVLVLPLVDGRMSAKALKGKVALATMRASFFADVGDVFGLTPGRERLTAAQRRTLGDAVLTRMNASSDPCMRSPAWQAIRDAIEANPLPFGEAVGLDLDDRKPRKKNPRTMAAIFTSRGKGPKHEARDGAS